MKFAKVFSILVVFELFALSAWAGNSEFDLNPGDIDRLESISESGELQVQVLTRTDRNNHDLIVLIGQPRSVKANEAKKIGKFIKFFSTINTSSSCASSPDPTTPFAAITAQTTLLKEGLEHIKTHCGKNLGVEFQNIEGKQTRLTRRGKKIDSILKYVQYGSAGAFCTLGTTQSAHNSCGNPNLLQMIPAHQEIQADQALQLVQAVQARQSTQSIHDCYHSVQDGTLLFSGITWSTTSLARYAVQQYCSELSPAQVPDEILKALRESNKKKLISLVRNEDFEEILEGLQKLGFNSRKLSEFKP